MKKQDELLALTLWRPWPHAIFYGGKRIENRRWKPWDSVIGKLIALHAGMKYDRYGAEAMREEGLYDPPKDEWCPKGCIVGTARVAGYVLYDNGIFFDRVGPEFDLTQRIWFSGPFGWKLDDITPFIKPVPCKGAQGLWPVRGDLLASVRAAYSESTSKAAEVA